MQEIDHDDVELSIHGSDEEFAVEKEKGANDGTEPGELLSSDDEGPPLVQVQSKVTKVTQSTMPSSKQHTLKQIPINKLSHLRHDPDFKKFLNKMMDKR